MFISRIKANSRVFVVINTRKRSFSHVSTPSESKLIGIIPFSILCGNHNRPSCDEAGETTISPAVDDTKSPSARYCFHKSRRQKEREEEGCGLPQPLARYQLDTLAQRGKERKREKGREEGNRGWSSLNEDEKSRTVQLFNIQG